MHAKYRIALVEPDVQIRQLSTRWLIAAGHKVDTRTIESLQIADGFDLLIVSVADPHDALPVIRGMQTVQQVPVLLTSARFRRGQDASTQLARQLELQAVLPKPFTRQELLQALAAAML